MKQCVSHKFWKLGYCSYAAIPLFCGMMQVKLQGIPGIRKVFMRELKTTHLDQDGIYQNENQWVLDTEGVNLLDVSSSTLTQCARSLFNPYFVVRCTCLEPCTASSQQIILIAQSNQLAHASLHVNGVNSLL